MLLKTSSGEHFGKSMNDQHGIEVCAVRSDERPSSAQYSTNNDSSGCNGTDATKRKLSSSEVSLFELILLTSFNFPYGLICGTFGLWILPAEAQRLFPSVQSVTLGLSLVVVGITQLVCPIAGKVSDLHVSSTRFGKRRSYILWGCISAAISTFGMWQSSLFGWGFCYYFFLFTGMAGLNVAYSVDCGLVPDFLDDDAQGKSSGLVAVHTLLGSGTGFALVVLTADDDFHFVYPMYVILVSVTCWLTCVTANKLESRVESQIVSGFTVHRKVTTETMTTADTAPITSEDSIPDSMDDRSVGVMMVESPPTESRLESPLSSDDLQLADFRGENRGEFSTTARVPSLGYGHPPLRRLSSSSKSIEVSSHVVKPAVDRWKPNQRQIPAYHDPQNISNIRRPGVTMADILDSFKIDVSTSYDFFWVFLGRTLYYIGVSVQAFMLFYLRDVVGTESEADRRFQLGCICLVAQALAACVAYPIGKYTDDSDIGRKPLIYLACLSMTSVYVAFLLSPLFGDKAFGFVLATAAIYGAGNGCFLAVDYALALATIPNKENTTQALGIWGVSAFIGSAIGPLLWGSVIEVFGRDSVTNHYQYSGYAGMLFGGMAATIGAGAIISLVKGVK